MKQMLLLLLLTGSPVFAGHDLSRYSVIMERAPFGKEPPPSDTDEPAKPAGEFVKQYRLCLLYKNAEGRLKAGLVNKTDNKNILLQVGGTEKGLSLIEVRLEEGVAVLRQNGETARMVLEGLAVPVSAPGTAAGAVLPAETAEMQPVIRTGPGSAPEHIRQALTDDSPKQARMTVRKTEPPENPADSEDNGEASFSGVQKKIEVRRAPSAYLVQSVPKRYSPL